MLNSSYPTQPHSVIANYILIIVIIIRRVSLKRFPFKSFANSLTLTWGQFNKTFTSVIYKCSYCFQTLKQWLQS